MTANCHHRRLGGMGSDLYGTVMRRLLPIQHSPLSRPPLRPIPFFSPTAAEDKPHVLEIRRELCGFELVQ